MKKSRFSDSQILSILKQAEAGTPVPELCREHGISSATFYKDTDNMDTHFRENQTLSPTPLPH